MRISHLSQHHVSNRVVQTRLKAPESAKDELVVSNAPDPSGDDRALRRLYLGATAALSAASGVNAYFGYLQLIPTGNPLGDAAVAVGLTLAGSALGGALWQLEKQR